MEGTPVETGGLLRVAGVVGVRRAREFVAGTPALDILSERSYMEVCSTAHICSCGHSGQSGECRESLSLHDEYNLNVKLYIADLFGEPTKVCLRT